MFRFGASAEPCGGIVVYKDRGINVAGFSGVNPWRIPRYFFFQGPCFFFSHSWHWFLLWPQQIIKNTPAFHRMKYDDGVTVNFIIHHFEQITGAVKADSDVFVLHIFHWTIILEILKGAANIFSADPMPERRLVELNDDFVHLPHFTAKAAWGQQRQ
jgi:hypothetical protein